MKAFLRRRAIRAIVLGAVLALVGIVITGATYASASSSPDGGVYFVPWGLIVIGLLWLIRGVAALIRSSRLP
jgi:F0F1-type ATP synthase assembly protein I